MVISSALPRTRLTAWVQSLSLRARPSRVSLSPLVASIQGTSDEHPRRAVTPSTPYALEFEEGEPTWEDAEWQ
jgi:hypothetical protein